MQKYFFPPGKHTNFHQGHKVFKAKGHMVIKARGQENLKPIFCTFYSSLSPFHPLLRHNIPNITEPMEIANCGIWGFVQGVGQKTDGLGQNNTPDMRERELCGMASGGQERPFSRLALAV